MISETKEFKDKVNAKTEIDVENLEECAALCLLVDQFADAMKTKLIECIPNNKHRAWEDPDWSMADMKTRIMKQLENVVPANIEAVDVANFALFLWNRNGVPK